jgi:hypothetical protein
MALYHVHTLYSQTPFLGKDPQNFALFTAVFAGDHFNDIVFPDMPPPLGSNMSCPRHTLLLYYAIKALPAPKR